MIHWSPGSGDDGDAVEAALQRGLEERLVRRRVERGVAEDLEGHAVVARRVLGAGLHPLGEGVEPVQDVGDLDVAVVRRRAWRPARTAPSTGTQQDEANVSTKNRS